MARNIHFIEFIKQLFGKIKSILFVFIRKIKFISWRIVFVFCSFHFVKIFFIRFKKLFFPFLKNFFTKFKKPKEQCLLEKTKLSENYWSRIKRGLKMSK
jgi:hypothetical protein